MIQQVNQYDKVFRENMEAVVPSLMANLLGIIAVSMEELPDDIQHTKERKPDMLKKVLDNQGNTFVLHIEFQVADEVEMVYRMAEYYIMLERKYKTPVKQFVIFLGDSNPKMPTQLDRERLKFDFPLLVLANIDYNIFLNSAKPEDIIIGILANFGQEEPENALRQIINRVKETTKGDFSLERCFNQLRILAQLRKLNLKLENAMESITKFFDEELDVLYKRGLEKGVEKGVESGIEKGKEQFVVNLLTQTDFSLDKIADLSGATLGFVKQVREKLENKKVKRL